MQKEENIIIRNIKGIELKSFQDTIINAKLSNIPNDYDNTARIEHSEWDTAIYA